MSDSPKPARRCVCKHLRSKEMYYSNTPLKEDLYHSGIYWCDLSHNGLGPDGHFADNEECSPARGCFEE